MAENHEPLPSLQVDPQMASGPPLNGDGNLFPGVKRPAPNGSGKNAGAASEDNFREFIENAAVALHWVGPDGIILWANQAELDMLGYAREEYIGHHISTFHADEPVIEDILARLTRGETLRNYESRLLCKDGSTRHVIISSNVLFENGKFIHTRCFTRDITERKQAEEKLRERSRLDSFAAQVGKGLIESGDLPDMLNRCTQAMVERLDAAFARIWTLNEQGDVLELQASSGLYTHLNGGHARVPVGSLKVGLIGAERKPHLTNRVIGDPRVPEQEWARREGMVAFAGYPMVVDGRLVGVIAMFSRHVLSDLTLQALERVASQIALGIERKRAENALRESESRLRAMVSQAAVGIAVVDCQGRLLEVNQRLCQMLGRSAGELCTLSCEDLTHPEDWSLNKAIIRETAEGARTEFTIEKRYAHANGSWVWVKVAATPMRDAQGRIHRLLVIVEDINERKRAEALVACQKQAFEMAASGVPLMEVLEFLARAAESQSYPGAMIAIHLLDESATRFELAAAPGLPPGYRRATEGLEVSSATGPCCVAVSGRRRVAIADVSASEEFPRFASFAVPLGIRAGWSAPFFSSTGNLLGTIAHYYRGACELHPEDDFLGEIVTRTAAIIVERKRAEDAVRRRTAQFETLLNEAPLGVYLVDGDFRVREVNPTALAAFGNIPDLIGRDFEELVHILWPESYADEIVQRFRQTLETGGPYIEPERIEKRRDRGVREYYEWQINRIPLPEGRYGVVCYFRDISRQVLAREAIAESGERLRFMAESMPQKIFTARPNGEVDYFNQQWTGFTGLSFEDIKNWGWTQFIHPDDVEENVRLWQNSIATGEPFKFIHRFRRFDGVYRWHLSRAHAMRDANGQISMWIGSNTEIHEQKEIEENLLRANEDLEQFAYSASHDLQEPIRNISVYGEVLSQRYGDALDAKGRQYLGFMTTGARRMEALVKDLLAYTQSARTADEAMEVDAATALAKALANLAEAIREAGAAVSHDTLPTLRVHEVQLQQLFQNLIGNAVKYRRDGEVPCIHVTAGREGAYWRFAVKDNGVGIPLEYRERIFGIFKRLHTDAKYSGTGIGLAICQKIVERNKGRIWVESDGEGKGSTFYFTLPAEGGI